MESVLGRYRNLIVLVAVLFAQVLGLAVQVRRNTDSEPTRLIRVWAVGAVTPLEKSLLWIQTTTRNVWHNYLYLRGVRAENRELKQELQQIRLEQVRMSQDAGQARRLQSLLSFKEQFISQTMAAQVIGWSGSEQSRSVYIDKGAREGIRPDMAVITKDGIVGKVLQVFGSNPLEASTAQVLLINDQTSGVGAILDKSRLQGILRGTPSGEVVLEKVMSDETVPVGEMVLTSGGDGIFPKGLPVGTVTKVSPGNDLFLNIRVRAAADLNRLEEVLVVTKIDERQAEPEQDGPIRAVDILAERLPTVPPKPDTATEGAPKTPAISPSATSGTQASGSEKPTTTVNPALGATPPNAIPKISEPGTSPSAEAKPKPNSGAPSAASGTAAPKVAASASSVPAVKKAGASVPSPGGDLSTLPAESSAAAKKPKPVSPVLNPQPQPAAQDAPQ